MFLLYQLYIFSVSGSYYPLAAQGAGPGKPSSGAFPFSRLVMSVIFCCVENRQDSNFTPGNCGIGNKRMPATRR